MNITKYCASGVLLLVSLLGPVMAESQMDLNKTACDELQKSDDSLNKVYQQILVKYKNDKVFIDQFVTAQKKWIQFKDAYVASMYIPQYQDSYGSALSMCQCYFIEKITNDRLKQIKVWIDGIEEGDVCTGSVTIR